MRRGTILARSPGRRSGRDAGFSLIEVLVTLTILAGLMAALTPLAGRMLYSWASGARQANRSDEIATAIDQLRRDIGGAFPIAVQGSDPPKLRFIGSPQGFTLVTRADDGPEQVSVSSAAGSDGKPSLVRGSRPLAAVEGGGGRETRVALLSGPLSARFSYRQRAGGKRDVWEASAEIPTAIEVTFFERGQPVFGGPVPLAVYSTLPIACVVAPENSAALCPNGEGQPAGTGQSQNGQAQNGQAQSGEGSATGQANADKPSFGASGSEKAP